MIQSLFSNCFPAQEEIFYPTTQPETKISVSLRYERLSKEFEGNFSPKKLEELLTKQRDQIDFIAKFIILDSWRDPNTSESLTRKTLSYSTDGTGDHIYTLCPNSPLTKKTSYLTTELAILLTKNAESGPTRIKILLDQAFEKNKANDTYTTETTVSWLTRGM